MRTAMPARAMMMLALAAIAGTVSAREAKPPPPPTGELLLDMDDPVITLKIGKESMRLRVGLEQKALIELNPEAAERLRADPPDEKFAFEPGFEAVVGRETLKGMEAAAPIRINNRNLLVLVASHGRDCCAGVDGEIGIGLLPYATIRFVRSGASDPGQTAEYLINDSSEHGPQSAIPIGKDQIFVQFAFDRPSTVATSSAAAILAQKYGGRREGEGTVTGAFGISRPTMMLTFRRTASVAQFRFDRLVVRTADFAGKFAFPSDPQDPDDQAIEVRKKVTQQDAWPVVLIGKDRLDACAEARYDTITRTLSLRCAPVAP